MILLNKDVLLTFIAVVLQLIVSTLAQGLYTKIIFLASSYW
jgi:hypothetical protein